MADPVTAGIGLLGIGSSIFGGAASAAGAQQQAQAQSQMYNYQAGIAQQNAAIALQNAGYASQTGENQAAISGSKSRQQIGQIVAAQGASGFQVGSGTNADVVSGQRNAANTDQTIIRSNAAKQAYDYDVQSSQYTAQAGEYKNASANALEAGNISETASILGTVGSVSSKWLQGNSSGMYSGIGSAAKSVANSIGSIF